MSPLTHRFDRSGPVQRTTGVYIAGPMSNIEENNWPLFYKAKKALLRDGYSPVICPPDITMLVFGGDKSLSPRVYMREDLKMMLLYCNTICVLDNWLRSTGAKAEAANAITLGFPFLYYDPVQDKAISIPTPDEIVIADGYRDDHRLTNVP